MVIITIIVQDKQGCIVADVNTYDGSEATDTERNTAKELTDGLTGAPDRKVTSTGERRIDGAQAVRR